MDFFFLDMNIQLKLDAQQGRVTFDGKSNIKDYNVTARGTEQCSAFKVLIHFSLTDIFQPILLDMNYAILDGVPDSEGMLIL